MFRDCCLVFNSLQRKLLASILERVDFFVNLLKLVYEKYCNKSKDVK